MVYLLINSMRLMRIIHIIAAQVWFGTAICIFSFVFYCFNNTAMCNAYENNCINYGNTMKKQILYVTAFNER
jgi:hypothetical protein